MSIDKAALKQFREHMVQAAKTAGVDLDIGTITFNEGYFRFSSKAYVIGGNGKLEEFKKYAAKKEVPLYFFNAEFITDKHERFKITGIKPRGRKNVLEITNMSNGKVYVCSVSYVQQFDLISKNAYNPVVNKRLT